MITEFTKDHVGRTIYALPTGNNVRRRGSNDPEPFVVDAVARRYVTVSRPDNRNWTEKLDKETGASEQAIKSGYDLNAGYKFFESEADARAHILNGEKRAKVVAACRGIGSSWNGRKLTDDEVAVLFDVFTNMGRIVE